MSKTNSSQKPLTNGDTNKRRILWIICIIFVLLIGALAVLELTGTTSLFHTENEQAASDTESNNKKKEAVVNNGGTPVGEGKDGTPSGDYTAPTTGDGIELTPSISGDLVIISTKLKGYSDGTCSLSITKGGNSTSQTAQVIYAPSFSSCAGFSVPKSTLGSGTWNITVSIVSGGNTTSKTITYEVK